MEFVPGIKRADKLGWIEVELKFWCKWMLACAAVAMIGPFL
jgi:hypothetical protein